MVPAIRTALLLTVLLFAGCASPPDPVDSTPDSANDPAPTQSVPANAAPTKPSSQPKPSPAAAVPVVQETPEAPLEAVEEAVPEPVLRPWRSLSLESGELGAVASFPWQTPADLPLVELEDAAFEVKISVTGTLTGWGLMYAEASGGSAKVTSSYLTNEWQTLRRNLTDLGQPVVYPPARETSFRFDTHSNWSRAPDGWIILVAFGQGQLNVALRAEPDVSYTSAEALIPLEAAVKADGAKRDWYVTSGTLTNAPSLTGGYIRIQKTTSLQVIEAGNLAPIALSGELRLNWSAPWAKWSEVSWSTTEHVGPIVVDYDVKAAGSSARGVMVSRERPVCCLGPAGTNYYGAFSGDGAGAAVNLGFTMATTGDWMGIRFSVFALGASFAELTGLPAPAVVALSTTTSLQGPPAAALGPF